MAPNSKIKVKAEMYPLLSTKLVDYGVNQDERKPDGISLMFQKRKLQNDKTMLIAIKNETDHEFNLFKGDILAKGREIAIVSKMVHGGNVNNQKFKIPRKKKPKKTLHKMERTELEILKLYSGLR